MDGNEENNLKRVVIHTKKDGTEYALYSDGKLWLEKGNSRTPVKITIKGLVYFGYSTRSLRLLVAKHFIPNPAQMPYVRSYDGDICNTSPDNLVWSKYPNVINLVKEAQRLEEYPIGRQDIFHPKIEIPETITLKSRV